MRRGARFTIVKARYRANLYKLAYPGLQSSSYLDCRFELDASSISQRLSSAADNWTCTEVRMIVAIPIQGAAPLLWCD
jgi:hypothetical protein